jgi:hypothetical protein
MDISHLPAITFKKIKIKGSQMGQTKKILKKNFKYNTPNSIFQQKKLCRQLELNPGPFDPKEEALATWLQGNYFKSDEIK